MLQWLERVQSLCTTCMEAHIAPIHFLQTGNHRWSHNRLGTENRSLHLECASYTSTLTDL